MEQVYQYCLDNTDMIEVLMIRFLCIHHHSATRQYKKQFHESGSSRLRINLTIAASESCCIARSFEYNKPPYFRKLIFQV